MRDDEARLYVEGLHKYQVDNMAKQICLPKVVIMTASAGNKRVWVWCKAPSADALAARLMSMGATVRVNP